MKNIDFCKQPWWVSSGCLDAMGGNESFHTAIAPFHTGRQIDAVENISSPPLPTTWRVTRLINTLGQTLEVGSSSMNELKNLHLPSGVYIVVLSNGNELKSQKIYLSNE
jgi:hypothetical protein